MEGGSAHDHGRGFKPVCPVNGTFTTITWPRPTRFARRQRPHDPAKADVGQEPSPRFCANRPIAKLDETEGQESSPRCAARAPLALNDLWFATLLGASRGTPGDLLLPSDELRKASRFISGTVRGDRGTLQW